MRQLRSCLLLLAAAAPLGAQGLDSATIAGLRWRNVGPANFMGRVSDVAGIPGPSKTLFVAAAGGGIWKTMNNGQTWRPGLRRQAGHLDGDAGDCAIGHDAGVGRHRRTEFAQYDRAGRRDLQVDRWRTHLDVHGTREDAAYRANRGQPARSQHRLRRRTRRRVEGESRARSLQDDRWRQELEADQVHQRQGRLCRRRDSTRATPTSCTPRPGSASARPYSLKSGGPGSGLWKSTDAGATWTEIKGGGFPEGIKGRIGFAIAPSNPDIVYALIEAADAAEGRRVHAGSRTGGTTASIARATRGKTWTQMNTREHAPVLLLAGARRSQESRSCLFLVDRSCRCRMTAARPRGTAAQQVHVDDHALWIDPNDPERWVIGERRRRGHHL